MSGPEFDFHPWRLLIALVVLGLCIAALVRLW